jgi:glycosyltransferase involved in cell wall biosynthesis
LSAKHHLDPWSAVSWVKGQTGGSDDHAGLFAGCTWTRAEADSKASFLDALRNKRTTPGGRYGDYKALAYGVYKIASEHMCRKQPLSSGLSGLLAKILFQEKGLGLRERLFLRKLGFRRSVRDQIMSRFLNGLWKITQNASQFGPDWQIAHAYEALGRLLDDFTASIAQGIEEGVRGQSNHDLLQYFSSTLPAILFATPFVSTLHILNKNRVLNDQLTKAFRLTPEGSAKRVLWFSDTIADLNGVSITMRELAENAAREKAPLRLVGCPTRSETKSPITDQMLCLPCIYEVTPTFYNAHTLRLPSLLRSLDLIADAQPDKIILSTPGPVGLTGYLAARLLGIPCEGVYHTDFTMQAQEVIGDTQVNDVVGQYINWFYARMDRIHVPSQYYMTKLADQGLDHARMCLFRRGLSSTYTQVSELHTREARERWFQEGSATLLYTGRLSKEKNLDRLVSVFERLRSDGLPVRLVLAGEGPERAALEHQLADQMSHVSFTGRLDRERLKSLYQLADVLLFPSETDTFGMSVLEAQTFGLPAVVSRRGGPQEIIIDGKTGYALEVTDSEQWVATCRSLVEARLTSPASYQTWRDEIKALFATRHSWKNLIDDITENRVTAENCRTKNALLSPEPPPTASRPRVEEALANA